MKHLKPTNDRVLFERVIPEAPKEGFALLKQEPTMECKVIAVGPKTEILKPGDRILVPFNYGYPLPPYEICREQEVHAVLT